MGLTKEPAKPTRSERSRFKNKPRFASKVAGRKRRLAEKQLIKDEPDAT